MPTRNRVLFESALHSVITAAATVADDVEVTVSDGSDGATGQVVERLLPGTGAAIIDAIRRAGPDEQVLMFGAQIAPRRHLPISDYEVGEAMVDRPAALLEDD
jgi:hypothetical protein